MSSYPTSIKSFTTRLTGDTIAPSHMNDVQDEVNAIETELLAGATSYVPVWSGTGVAIGDGTIAGAYHQVGTLVYYRIALTIGSTSNTGSGVWSLTLPFTSISAAGYPAGSAVLTDVGANLYLGAAVIATTTTIQVFVNNAATAVAATVPFTWVAGDVLAISGCYVKA